MPTRKSGAQTQVIRKRSSDLFIPNLLDRANLYNVLIILLLLLMLLYFLYHVERAEMIAAAVVEAKVSAELNAFNAELDDLPSSSPFLSKGFKKASPEAAAHAKARLLFEDMVYRAEKKIEELHNKNANPSYDPEARAEELAEELFHVRGTRLTENELQQLWVGSECPSTQPQCTQPAVATFRTIDGTCNNLVSPKQGAASTQFRRILPAWYEDGISSLRGRMQAMNGLKEKENVGQIMKVGPFEPPLPSARIISQTVIGDKQLDENSYTHMLMQWGQFLDHDLDLAPELPHDVGECSGCEFLEGICEPILVPQGDMDFGSGTAQDGNCLHFRRSATTCDNPVHGSFSAREQINDLTSYIDGSMIYGSSATIAKAVRSFKDGLLVEGSPVASGGKATLPLLTIQQKRDELAACVPADADCYLAGDVRVNEQVALTTVHTVWLREHNRIARELKCLNSHWNDERIFQETRKIVGAQLQKITYFDYLPKILGPRAFHQVIDKYTGYDSQVNASVPNAFATAAFRFGHSLIQPYFSRLDQSYDNDDPLPLYEAFFNMTAFLSSSGTDRLLRGLVTQSSMRMDECMNSVLTSQLFQTGSGPGLDLASLDIQRQRDHGMAPYVVWRNFCRHTFPSLGSSDIESQLTFIRFLQLYGSLDNVDLWVGGLSEERVEGSLLGETFACIVGLTFRNLRSGDRFYFENNGVFTPEQKIEIMKSSLSRVICDNADNIATIQPDAFLSNQTRQACSSLPSINLQHWKELDCYMRIEQDGSVNRKRVTLLYQTLGSWEISGGKFGKGADQSVLCLPMECPSYSVMETLSVFLSRRQLQKRCVAHASSQFPLDSKSSSRGVYTGTGFSASHINSGSGVYSSLSLCQEASAVPGVTFSCAHLASQEEEDCDKEVDSGSPDNYCDQLPEDILQKIREEQMANGTEQENDDNTVPNKSSWSTYADEDDLIRELSETLNKLN